jgi:hypothetical protein
LKTPLHLDIDAHGRLVPQSDEVRRALADRAGRFVLVPAASDLLLARRTPGAGGTTARPRCLLAGDLSGFPIVDFLGFVHQSRLSGVLEVSSGAVERSITFRDGEVRSADSTGQGERLRDVVVRLGYATETQVGAALATKAPFPTALVALGAVSANDLWKCLHEQVAAIFQAILLSPAGVFFLVDEEPPEREGPPLAVNTQSLLMDGIRRIDEMSLFKARIPGAGAHLRRRTAPRPVTLRPTELSVLALVDGVRSVGEIAAAAHLNEFDATKLLYHLSEAGQVEVLAGPGPALPAERVPKILDGMNGLLRGVAGTIPEDRRAAALSAVRAYLGDPANLFAPLFEGVPLAVDGSLDGPALRARLAALEPAALARLDASADPGRALLEAMRDALFFWMFVAGDRISRDADEAMSAAVKHGLADVQALA